MKKLYVIKKNDNEYLQYFDTESDDIQFTKDISLSMLYDENEKEIIKEAYSNMNWIYVEIIMEEANKLEHNQNQKAIECLKDVKDWIFVRTLFTNEGLMIYKYIDNKIKELEVEE